MTLSQSRCGYQTVLALLVCLQLVLVRGIEITYCGLENTGSGSFPNNYGLQSLGHCRDQCSGFAFAIAQGKNCWCSDYAPSETTSKSNCNEPCPGFPYEFCGSTSGDYSYLQIGLPSGTGGPFVAPSSTKVVVPIVVTPPPETVFQTVENTVVSSNVVVRTTAVILTRVITRPASTRIQTSLVAVTRTRPVTTEQVVTVGGDIQTRYITYYPSHTAAASGERANLQRARSGLSNGAVAGITIGVIAACAILGFLLFCCWRKRKNEKDSSGITRNTSVLSKAGLLRHSSNGSRPLSAPLPTYVSSSAPRLDTDIPTIVGGTAGAGMLQRKGSIPLFQDNRLNPNAIMNHPDTSRTSIGTLQDERDYSRPLEVRNPDPPRSSYQR